MDDWRRVLVKCVCLWGTCGGGKNGRSYSGRRMVWMSLAKAGFAPRVARGMGVWEGILRVEIGLVCC